VALDATRLPRPPTVVNLSLLQLKRSLRTPQKQVPVLCWGDAIIADSTEIMRFLDARPDAETPPFFPDAETPAGARVASVEEQADALLSPFLRYYALYDDDGFARCLKQQARGA
jgi:hypothetical protein